MFQGGLRLDFTEEEGHRRQVVTFNILIKPQPKFLPVEGFNEGGLLSSSVPYKNRVQGRRLLRGGTG